MVLKVKYIKDVLPLEKIECGDWIDLRCAETVSLSKFESTCIPLGVAIELPPGYSAIIVPRSSTFKRWGIIQTNSIGIIDESYKGDNDEWMLPVLAMRDTIIYKNDRICQFRLIKKDTDFIFKPVKNLNNENRGGFGSTGRA